MQQKYIKPHILILKFKNIFSPQIPTPGAPNPSATQPPWSFLSTVTLHKKHYKTIAESQTSPS